MMKSLLLALLLLEATAVSGFQSRVGNTNRCTPHSLLPLQQSSAAASYVSGATPEEARAAALSEYLAKSHEEKLKAIKDMETKKNAEIIALKEEMAQLRQGSSSSTSASASTIVMQGDVVNKALEDMTKEELVSKIGQYQTYMQQYMVGAQEQKYKAVQVAQAAGKKNLADAMLQLGAATPSSISEAPATTVSTQSPLYAARSAAVSKAGANSRWGAMEVERAGNTNGAAAINGAAAAPPVAVAIPVAAAAPPVAAAAPPVAVDVPVPPEVAAADHGLRADGGVGGLTLAERIFQASGAAAPVVLATTPVPSQMEVLYTQRNIKVIASAAAGKSRWGQQEVDRVQNIVTTTSSLPAGRMNLGASIVGSRK